MYGHSCLLYLYGGTMYDQCFYLSSCETEWERIGMSERKNVCVKGRYHVKECVREHPMANVCLCVFVCVGRREEGWWGSTYLPMRFNPCGAKPLSCHGLVHHHNNNNITKTKTNNNNSIDDFCHRIRNESRFAYFDFYMQPTNAKSMTYLST